ncbi:hypothetical protein B7C51_04805 [Paenibacillus larvae subsp. pulvifaciens]|uniref:Uncharacterized protein n=1 Tax=Paenibacillus larvae subsp. pulvifaciens TaxID=1477 RepID=A0A1V0UQ77_9BACL|nr:hypothetical protein [Paenibacillus larvae]ARF67291.1 hypothetical protein B7C51_04805 [Paenibacillus larvae subsp. pulvifaciens]
MIRMLTKKKHQILVFLSMVLTLTLSPNAYAHIQSNCNQLTVCKKSIFTSSDSFVQSEAIYLKAGQAFDFGFNNYGSKHNIGYGIYRYPDYTLVYGPKLVSARVKSDWNSYGQAPTDGYYYIRAQCGGTGQTGCNGYAWIAK